ncbi:hypothetical protein L1085_000560 [Streptomyces sp. MSC1_001]|jgi:hypothetical protein|uniref:hypothetical protein n=1 Tax=Streptomyces sp. MSC1_001 TaxID=2909263 RepID=UPI00202EE1C3|nr:hypothetical protein [Streptomyces sp. MSC1_001]
MVIFHEEINAAMVQLKRYWAKIRESGDPKGAFLAGGPQSCSSFLVPSALPIYPPLKAVFEMLL